MDLVVTEIGHVDGKNLIKVDFQEEGKNYFESHEYTEIIFCGRSAG